MNAVARFAGAEKGKVIVWQPEFLAVASPIGSILKIAQIRHHGVYMAFSDQLCRGLVVVDVHRLSRDPIPVFAPDPRLEASSIFLADLGLCQARIQGDARWPWMVLIPRRAGLRELEDLGRGDLDGLTQEILSAGRAVRAIGAALDRPVEKLNVGALGNVVAQLHIHVVGRRRDDPAWPGPVWGFGAPVGYHEEALKAVLGVAEAALLS